MTAKVDSAAAIALFSDVLDAAPMLDADRTFGMLVLSRDHPRQRFNEEQLDFFVELTAEAALELSKIILAEEAAADAAPRAGARPCQAHPARHSSGELPCFRRLFVL